MNQTLRRVLAPLLLAGLVSVGVAVPAALAQLSPIGAPREAEGAKTRAKPFRLGIVAASRSEAAVERVDPFRRRLARVLDGDVAVTPFTDETALIGALVAGRVDYAPLSAVGYATASRLCGCVEPLAAPRAADRAPGWFAIVLVAAGGGVASVDDLAGRRLAIASNAAIGTGRLPSMLLERAGLVGARSPRRIETDGPAEALQALLDGRADAAVVWSSLDGDPQTGWSRGTLADFVAAGRVEAGRVRMVWSSPILPLGPHTVRATLDEPTKRRLREMLIELDADPDVYEAIEPAASGGFVRVGAPAYRPFVDLLTPPGEAETPPETTGSAPPKG